MVNIKKIITRVLNGVGVPKHPRVRNESFMASNLLSRPQQSGRQLGDRPRESNEVVGLVNLQAVLLLGTADFRPHRAIIRRPLTLAHVAQILKPTCIVTNKEENMESKEYKVNNRMMNAKEVESLLSGSGCDLLCPSQIYPDVFRSWCRHNSYQGCVFKLFSIISSSLVGLAAQLRYFSLFAIIIIFYYFLLSLHYVMKIIRIMNLIVIMEIMQFVNLIVSNSK